ncbi:unnamed protein product, partial [Eretmochelys imbricata]
VALEFVWPGLHWVSAGVLRLPLEEGGQGQGQVCLRSQVHVFHPQALQRLLHGAGSLARSMVAHAFLCCLSYIRQLFFLHPRGLLQDLSELLVFCQDLRRPGSCSQRPGPLWPPRGQTSLQSPCYTTPTFMCRWRSSLRCAKGWFWQKPPESETSWTMTGGLGGSPDPPPSPCMFSRRWGAALSPTSRVFLTARGCSPLPPALRTFSSGLRPTNPPSPLSSTVQTSCVPCSRFTSELYQGNNYTLSYSTRFSFSPSCPTLMPNGGIIYHLWRVRNPSGPASIPPWSHSPPEI